MAQPNVDSVVKMKQETHDFGKIKQGVPATTYFEFKNISNKPVVVQTATAGCGCTKPEWDSLPVPPGGTAKIKVGYNAAAIGQFTKDVYITFAGIPQQKTIHITGEVLGADAYEEWLKQNPPSSKPTQQKNMESLKDAKSKPTKSGN
jgi:hypothetical protein